MHSTEKDAEIHKEAARCLLWQMPGLDSEFQDSQGFIQRPVLKTNKQTSQHLEAETGGSLQVKVSLLYIEFQDSQGYPGSLGMAYNREKNLS